MVPRGGTPLASTPLPKLLGQSHEMTRGKRHKKTGGILEAPLSPGTHPNHDRNGGRPGALGIGIPTDQVV